MAEQHSAPPGDFYKITPVAQKMAADLGVDLDSIQGSGDHGKITKVDVQRAGSPNGGPPAAKTAPKPAPAPKAASATPPESKSEPTSEPQAAPKDDVLERQPLKGIRKVIARRMAESTQTTSRVTLMTDVDATEFVAVRQQLKAKYAEAWGFAPGYNDLLVIIVANALREFPYMNARFSEDGEAIERLKPVNMGMAVDTDRGLLVPVVKNADKKGLQAIGAEFRELTQKARSGKASPDELGGSTFTISS
ncbi:MAG: 2-oxo acid dehydrogenase subunit E2, partial [Anaerolineae bacterium]|nr:2-oxo acid dehydrogenase subunit E2 [Anaerolineae bacterium]